VKKITQKYNLTKELFEKTIQEKVDQARKDEVLKLFEDILMTVWNRLIPILGKMTVTMIFKRSLDMTLDKYSIIENLKIHEEGLVFQEQSNNISDKDFKELKNSLMEYIANLIDILATLTGNVIVNKLFADFEINKNNIFPLVKDGEKSS